ncbi:MAG TPA: MTAP family purine nucleoside phosphorylase [Syntrophorhabdaceae bacterium]|nr:MTAP family purine nucleoside phosphorylase [Syntrophorhabdaceae bacterium]HQM81279.1 MTAP family purine nucleoside phosphorylase [Syntrophorhabdaceae bacterium]
MNAIIGGTSLLNSSLFSPWKSRNVKTPYGSVRIRLSENTAFLQRHGDPPVPPHRINHRANIWALRKLGAVKIISINSVGSLKPSIKPGTLLIPDDFLSVWSIPTLFEKEMRFFIPEMDKPLARHLHDLCKKAGIGAKSGGIYIQTIGPRLETKAEIRMLKGFGDIVGMTMASEATLSMEYGIPYASLCSIDNYCNGIAKTPLTMEQIMDNVQKNLGSIERIIEALVTKGIA